MIWLVTRYAITSLLVVAITEFAKRSDRLGGFVAALPVVTLLTLFWLFIDKQSDEKIANHAFYTFWYVIPTLPMFLAFPILLPKFGFWITILICVLLTMICFGIFATLTKSFGITLV